MSADQHEQSEQEQQGTEKPGGLGDDGTIPAAPNGIGATTGEESTFEPEEDELADDDASAPDPQRDAGLGV